jgi:hypothetical protein
VRTDTIGAAWLAVVGRILAEGVESRYDGLPVREISLVTLVVAHPAPADEIIARHAEPERLAWMHANFTDHARVAALGDADSYATRLFDYEHSGRNQRMIPGPAQRLDHASMEGRIAVLLARPVSAADGAGASDRPEDQVDIGSS